MLHMKEVSKGIPIHTESNRVISVNSVPFRHLLALGEAVTFHAMPCHAMLERYVRSSIPSILSEGIIPIRMRFV